MTIFHFLIETFKIWPYSQASMALHDKKTLQRELQNSKILYVFPTRNNQTLPDVAFTTTFNESQKLMEEVGSLRKKAFEADGVKVRGELDLDEHDLRKNHPYNSFFIWSQDTNQILTSYRYFIPDQETIPGHLAITEVFNLTMKYFEDYLYSTIDLGRSFVIPELQADNLAKERGAVFNEAYTILGKLSLGNDGEIKRFGGKITLRHPETPMQNLALGMALTFLDTFKQEGYLNPIQEYHYFNLMGQTNNSPELFRKLFEQFWPKNNDSLNTLIMTYYKTAKEGKQESKLITFGNGTYPAKSTGYNGIETAIILNFADFAANKRNIYIKPHLRDQELQESVAKDFDIYKGIRLDNR